ncbi:MAG: hypothetical protein HXM81_05705 [Neisseria sicca]|nr:hypothetical protein [Neisseria sicca]
MAIKDSRKNSIDWHLPIGLSILSTVFVLLFMEYAEMHDLFIMLINFIQILPGFFIAALAAIATFDKKDLDELMASPSPRIKISRNGGVEEIRLSRRRYLTLMFSFLTSESILIIVITAFSLKAIPSICKILISKNLYFPVIGNVFLFFLFFLFFWQLIIVSFYGLYYLGERIHQPN